MNTVHINASKSYDVHIGSGLLQNLAHYTQSLNKNAKIVIISDSNVWPIYGETTANILRNAGHFVCHMVFPAGESSKSGYTYLNILNFLADCRLTRSDLLIALGGGVVGDITGFAAATYLRGIAFIQIPTTLLAMVDSSVGGKTAIDLPAGKNLAGAFYQPSLVLCDTDTLDTLPEDVFCDGCAEVIKYGVLYDASLFQHLLDTGFSFNREQVITRCVELKAAVVAKDEFDTGERQKLNLGHTIGHGIEAQSEFCISHGQAVAMGMALVTKAAVANGICKQETYAQLIAALQKFKLPCLTKYSAEQLYECALSDKKRSGGTVNLIVPEVIGTCHILPKPVSKLKSFIEAGL